MANLLNDKERERFRAHQLLQQGRSTKFVANTLKRDTKWVRRTERRFEELGSFKDRPRTGQPKKLSSRDSERLVKQVKGKERRSTRKVALSFKSKDNKKVSRETIRKSLKTAGLYPHKKRKVTLLTQGQKIRRVGFAEKYRREDWSNYAFWDETESELVPTPNRKNDIIWDEKGAEYRQGQVAHPASFKYGVAITVHGPTRLVPYTGTIDAPKYQNMIAQVIPDLKKMFGKKKWTWVQDGARPHIAKSTQEFLAKKVPAVLPKKDWPANSPDLSPIEYANGYVDSNVQAKNSRSLRILETNVRNEWKKLTPEYCQNLINGLPKRLKQVIRTKGEYVYEANDM
jgi:transposase